jgi:hypothetical protein
MVRLNERVVNDASTKDWLAFINVSGGGGSWARGADRQDTIRRCLRIFKSDWSGLLELAGAEVTVIVADVTGHDQVRFDDGGVWVEPFDKHSAARNWLDRDRIDVVSHIYPGKPKKRK